MPYLPITLISEQKVLNVSALIDSGATVSVIPFSIGIQLGLNWQEQTTDITLKWKPGARKSKRHCFNRGSKPFLCYKVGFCLGEIR